MKIEEGKRYVRRDGSVSGPISRSSIKIYCWTDGLYSYTRYGIRMPAYGESSIDLIADYKEGVDN